MGEAKIYYLNISQIQIVKEGDGLGKGLSIKGLRLSFEYTTLSLN